MDLATNYACTIKSFQLGIAIWLILTLLGAMTMLLTLDCFLFLLVWKYSINRLLILGTGIVRYSIHVLQFHSASSWRACHVTGYQWCYLTSIWALVPAGIYFWCCSPFNSGMLVHDSINCYWIPLPSDLPMLNSSQPSSNKDTLHCIHTGYLRWINLQLKVAKMKFESIQNNKT
jgi:hypothetical protein